MIACQMASARPRHAHREIEQAQGRGPVGKMPQHAFVAPHPGEAIDLPRKGLSHDGMEEQVRFARTRGLQSHLDMGAVKRVAGLESNDAPPAELAEALAQLGGGVAKRTVVVMQNRPEPGDPAAHIDRMGAMEEVGNAGMRLVKRAVHGARLLILLGPPHLADLHDGGEQPFGVAKRDGVAALEPPRERLAHVERHRDRPDLARWQPHVAQHSLVLGRAHEPLKRGEGAVQQEIEIAELARGKVPALRVASPPPCFAKHRLVGMPVRELAALLLLEHPNLQFPQ